MGFVERTTHSRRGRILLQTLAVISFLIMLVLYVGMNKGWFEFTNAMSLTFIILIFVCSTATLLLSQES